MKYLAAYALLTLSGKKDITPADIKSVLGSVQSAATDDDINRVIAALKGKSINQLIAQGSSRLGGAGGVPAAVSSAKPSDAKKEAPKKQQGKKKQEVKKVEQPPAEQQMDMGGLFD